MVPFFSSGCDLRLSNNNYVQLLKQAPPTMQATSEVEWEKLVGRDAPWDPHSLGLWHKQTQKEDRQEGPFGFICLYIKETAHGIFS